MKSEKEKSGRFLIIAICFLIFISTAQGAWDNDDLMYAKGTSGGQLTVHNINTEEDFENIQDAIDDPDTKDGHKISVDAGIYRERVVINKQLKIIGENKDTTIIDGYGSGNCIQVTADNVEISGFTIKNGNYGIYLESSNCHVIDNNITSIDFDGISLRSNSVNNTIAHNRLSMVKRRSIDLSSSSNNRIHDNDLSENDKGISLYSSHNNIFYHNRLTNNSNCGISLTFSKNNVIRDNDLSGSDKGIDLSSSDKNYIYHNNFMDNRIQAKDSRDTNHWDKGREDGGNYWSDHKCTGNPSDGSQPYDISVRGATDNYPFMNRDGWTCTLPSPPTLTDPGTNDTDGNYTVSWSSVTSATNYTLEEDTSISFSSPAVVYSGSGTSKEITGKSDGTYYYQVKACNECGCSEWSNREDINIDTIPPTVTITYPPNEQTLTTSNITVIGTASDNVEVSKVEVKVGSGSWQRASGTTLWSTPVTLVPGPNTINASATDRLGNTNQTSVRVFVIGESSVTISVIPSTINLSESVNISGNINLAHSANVTLTFTTPNNATQKNSTTSTPNGSYYFVFQPEEVGNWTVNATWAGDSDIAGNTSKTVSFTVNPDKVGYAIIIAGSKYGYMSDAIDRSAKNTYKVLLNCGFTPERIFYLNLSGGQDVNGDGNDDVDNISYRANIIGAIEKWAQDKVNANAPLLIYMLDNIENDTFFVNGINDTLTASDMNNSLNNLTIKTKCDNITVVCEGCNSGNFIHNLSSRGGRIIVTSTGVAKDGKIADSDYSSELGGVFSYCFFDNIFTGENIRAAFVNASNSQMISEYNTDSSRHLPQTPLLDDNGDGDGHNSSQMDSDGSLAASRHIGIQGGSYSDNNCIPVTRLEGVRL